LKRLGATAAIGSLTDADFLTSIRLPVPMPFTPWCRQTLAAESLQAYQNETGKSYAEAIKRSGLKKVVALSSIGAHLGSGVGPIKGIHDVEGILSQLDGVAVKFVRAPFFLYSISTATFDLIKHQGILSAPTMLPMQG
jgi:hypothetical protein